MACDELERWYWWSQIILAGIVFISALIALIQFSLLKRQSRATFLLDLDRRWESSDLSSARALIADYKLSVENVVQQKGGTDDDKRTYYKQLFKRELDDIYEGQPAHYLDFQRTWGFFETLGYLVKNDYLTREEAANLFGFSVQQFEDMARTHIEARDKLEERKTGKPPRLYENALYLASSVSDYVLNTNISGGPLGYLRKLGLWLRGFPLP